MTERNAKPANVSTPIFAGVCEANSKLKTASGSFEQIGQSGNRAIGQSGNRAIGQSGNYTHSLTNHVNYLTV